ncbi:MAG: ATP-dependent Clp protease adaptor ClpS [Candidatus Obscuribacterales bacterium]|nr:ATP-dependent Clp protease adaptor ClpS [Candidatus Obscuribacterales bacterium]
MIDAPTKINLDVLTITKTELTWRTILFNCNCHTFDTVIEQLMKAINCSYIKASQLANVADQLGSVTVCTGTKGKCEDVAGILGSVGLEAHVTQ